MKEISIKKLIKYLKEEKKNGGKTIQFKGTLLCPENGNSIVITTEKQM
jgi:hypothetical protein